MKHAIAIGLALSLMAPVAAYAQDIDVSELAPAVGVEELANRWTEAYNLHDAEALGAFYTETAHLYLHGQPMLVGREAIQDYWAADMLEGNPLTVLTVTNRVEGFDMILVHGNYQVIDRDTGLQQGQGRFAHIWILDDGDWLLDRDLWNQPAFEENGGSGRP